VLGGSDARTGHSGYSDENAWCRARSGCWGWVWAACGNRGKAAGVAV